MTNTTEHLPPSRGTPPCSVKREKEGGVTSDGCLIARTDGRQATIRRASRPPELGDEHQKTREAWRAMQPNGGKDCATFCVLCVPCGGSLVLFVDGFLRIRIGSPGCPPFREDDGMGCGRREAKRGMQPNGGRRVL